MGVSSTYTPVREIGNGAKLDFDFTFKCFATSELRVYKIVTATGVATLQTLGVDYTAVLNTVTEGGTVSYTVAPTALQTSFIGREVANTQDADIPSVSVFREAQIENALDKRTMVSQQIEDKQDRTLTFAETEDMAGKSAVLPTPVANKILGWNAGGTAIENKTQEVTTSTYPGVMSAGLDASKSASPTAKDVYFAIDTGKIYLCEVAGAWVHINDISTLVALTGNQTVAGIKTFSSSPIVPTPTTDTQASTKKYVDDVGVTATTKVKVGAITRDSAAADGDVAETGVGFQPKAIIVFSGQDGANEWSKGFADGTTQRYEYYKGDDGTRKYGAGAIVFDFHGVGDTVTAVLKSFDAGGFTLTWGKTGSPTGNLVVSYICIG